MADTSTPTVRPKRPQYYVCVMTNVVPAPQTDKPLADIHSDHIAYLTDLERRGVLLAAGPFRDIDGTRHGAGMMIIRAASIDEAERISAEEPYRKYGLRDHSPMPWQWAEGSITQTFRMKAGDFDIR